MRKLPPLRSLQVFESAARLQHFSRAAEELCISQSAVSHQIKQLESYYGEQLFLRSTRQLQLTDKGAQLSLQLESTFNALEEVSLQITGDGNQQLRLAVYSSFAIKWLIPRLSEFRQQHPHIQIRLDMITSDPQLSDNVADMFITGQSNQNGYMHLTLHKERLIAVASPDYLQQWLNKPNASPQELIAALPSATLLTVDEGELGIDWQRWHTVNKADDSDKKQQHIFSHVLMAIEAAIAHQGIALASDFMVKGDIAAGRLVALDLPDILTGFNFNFSCKQRRQHEPALASFIQWLKRQSHSGG
ncbi:Glycine cleavage system transcriptional activator [Shewanella sp. P1-14-1]|uniref:LysR substrate-binding domain-containing protein n=1 Tax=Shewanella sp. P1-14-1 TaxID=1723761 RepID=UPI0006D671C7|nr:LysR substrate-binding domain-containing protein [Shewanella sp. P1-14-1]KPZ67920.1 Glycine cleavage system transcriptional activator [Shewanella sp. P1-14-1]